MYTEGPRRTPGHTAGAHYSRQVTNYHPASATKRRARKEAADAVDTQAQDWEEPNT